jgi:RHS repeat-associated protein
MSTTLPETVLCRYHYDPLDRLVDCALLGEAGIQRFYCKSRLATEIQGAVQHSVFQHEDQLLAQLRREDVTVNASLLATDQQRSVLNVLDASKLQSLVYTPYGHRHAENGLLSLLGFNGERPDPVTGHYLLGNGYRAFNPVLMRFNSPDSWSPFGKGGINAYAYCGADPRNRMDPSGHVPISALTKALAAYRTTKENLKISQASKTISKLTATKGDNVTLDTLEARKLIKNSRDRTRRRELKELANLIKENEATLPPSEKARYTWAVKNNDLNATHEQYNNAKALYKFSEKFPNTDVMELYEGRLDVGHFDITTMHFRNMSNRKEPISRDRTPIHRAEILRAVYIKKHIGIDLMSIRQQSPH